MPDILLEVATLDHVPEIAARMRAPDRAEVLASGGFSPQDAICASLAVSEFASVAYFRGELAAMFGVVLAQDGPWAVPWLLTTDVVSKMPPFAFYTASKIVLREIRKTFPDLRQAIDARHRGALAWVKRLGFTVGEAQTWGAAGLMFHPIRLGIPASG